jgi:CMP-N,N'-diacetyllegionaminic acid synthase
VYEDKTIVGFIPARGGSKGLPNKNILPLLGKPLISWTIEQAKNSLYIDKIIVSTEDEEIAGISRKYGAQVPFLRPAHIATDDAKTIDAVLHALGWFESMKEFCDLLIVLQPTSPLRTAEDIDRAVELLFSKKAQSVVSVCEVGHHPYLSNTLPENHSLKDFLKPEVINTRRQDMPSFYRLNGAIYLSYCEHLQKEKHFFGDNSYAYIMPKERSIDIDNEIDFKFAEFLLKEYQGQYVKKH